MKNIVLNLNSGMLHYIDCPRIKESKKIEKFYTFDEAEAVAKEKGLYCQKCSICIK